MSEPPDGGKVPTSAAEARGRVERVAVAVQAALERLYRLDRIADVRSFVAPVANGGREVLLVRETEDGTLEMRLHLPPLARTEFDVTMDSDLDPLCQVIEGVSHFVYLAHRASARRETTQLELEVQAEVDKYVILAAALRRFDAAESAALRGRLYESVSFAHEASTPLGERYRIANSLARRYVRWLEVEFVARRRFRELRDELRRFFHLGQQEKLRVGQAA